MNRTLWFAVLLLWAATSGISQEPAPPVMTLNVTTNLVVLDVVVTNRKGVPVNGLTEQDFSLFEEGKPQIIKSFDASVSHGETGKVGGKDCRRARRAE